MRQDTSSCDITGRAADSFTFLCVRAYGRAFTGNKRLEEVRTFIGHLILLLIAALRNRAFFTLKIRYLGV